MKLASWNINSLKVRLPHALNWLTEHQPGILGTCPRIENLLRKIHFGQIFQINSLNNAPIRLIYSKNLAQNGIPSLRFLFSDKLLGLQETKVTAFAGDGRIL